jgi:hypothetical protein
MAEKGKMGRIFSSLNGIEQQIIPYFCEKAKPRQSTPSIKQMKGAGFWVFTL